MGSQVFRAGVVVVVCHPDGRVLAMERTDAPGEWQLPQGGLELGEEPAAGAWRELHEETGLHSGDVAMTGEHDEWVAYEWPPEVREGGKRRGQVQRWFRFELVDGDAQPVADGREFSAWRWVEPGWLTEHVIEMRRAAYERVLPQLVARVDG
jgi:putative (di)nucleoside polyphosphate hydrolase